MGIPRLHLRTRSHLFSNLQLSYVSQKTPGLSWRFLAFLGTMWAQETDSLNYSDPNTQSPEDWDSTIIRGRNGILPPTP